MTAVIVLPSAERQLREIAEWWMAHRPASPRLVREDLERCLSLLDALPGVGARFHRSRVPGVRRLPMRRTRHHVYCRHDEANAIIHIIAVWGAPKLGPLPLFDPDER